MIRPGIDRAYSERVDMNVGMGPPKPIGTPALGGTDGDVGAQLAGSCQQGQGQQIARNHHQRPASVARWMKPR